MIRDKKQEKISGRTYIKDETIIWDSDEGLLNQIPIKSIKVIGEYTTSAGPIFDDWFILFVLNPDNIKQVSAYATGTQNLSAGLWAADRPAIPTAARRTERSSAAIKTINEAMA